jgi:type I restriction enzyme S subunit
VPEQSADAFNTMALKLIIRIQLQSLQKSSFCLRCHELKTRPYKLSELGSFISGGKFAKGDFSPQGLPAISYGDLFTSFTVYVDTPHHFVQANKATLMSSDHDLLFPSSTTVDASSLISPAALSVPGVALGSDIFVLRVRPEFSNVYLSLLINYVYKLPLSRLAQGSTITHLHYRDIQDFRLELPSLLDQKKAADSFLTFSKRVAVEKAILKNLISLRVFLLKGLFL